MGDLISEYRVMRSAAGWYLGQEYYDTNIGDGAGYWLPYDRLTRYFINREEAEDILRFYLLNDLNGDDNEYILTRLYLDDIVSFWHNLENFS